MTLALGAAGEAAAVTWPEIVTLARGQQVNWCMPEEPARANKYLEGYLAPRLMEIYGDIRRRAANGAGL